MKRYQRMEAMLPYLAPALNKQTNKTNKTPLDDGWMMYFYYILPCLPPLPPINKQKNKQLTNQGLMDIGGLIYIPSYWNK